MWYIDIYTGNMDVLPGVYTRKLLNIIYVGVHMRPNHQTLMVLFPCNPGWKNSVSSQ